MFGSEPDIFKKNSQYMQLQCALYTVQYVRFSSIPLTFLRVFSNLDSSSPRYSNIKLSPRYVAHRGDQAHRGGNFMIEYLGEIENEIRKYFSLFIRGPDGFEP